MNKYICATLSFFLSFTVHAAEDSIILHTSDATIWLADQTIQGEVKGFSVDEVTIHHNDSSFTIPVAANGTFSIHLQLKDSLNIISAEVPHLAVSKTIRYTLGYNPFPLIKPLATVKGNKVILSCHTSLKYYWKASPSNPAPVKMKILSNGSAEASIPNKNGEYYFTLYANTSSLTDSFKTFVTRSSKGLTAFNIEKSKASWINESIIYQITPHHFISKCNYSDIEAKLPEFKDLGVNTIYLQPLFKTQRGGQGYDVIDFFNLRLDFGTEQELQSLITAAKSLHMRVLFDMVPNHTSIYHPYAKDKILNDTNSHYYHFYQVAKDSALYASHYHEHPDKFIYYFWNGLMNLDYNNPEVQQWMIEICKYWVRKYDIDGYRFDAVWGVNARTPSFGKRLQLELKSLKPDLLLIAEDQASAGNSYKQGFDAAYDWAKDEAWVSHWSWQYDYDSMHKQTIFNHPSISKRKELMRKALFCDGDSIGLRLRYLENNDQHRFIENHSLAVTKMAATLMFSLPGIPMLYNGQEIGDIHFPYRPGIIFERSKSIRSLNPDLFDFYKKLSSIRNSSRALRTGSMKEISLKDGEGTIAFLRSIGSEKILVIMNMSENEIMPALTMHETVTDLLTNERFIINGSIPVKGFTTRVLLIKN